MVEHYDSSIDRLMYDLNNQIESYQNNGYDKGAEEVVHKLSRDIY
jgi:hypothetical protein